MLLSVTLVVFCSRSLDFVAQSATRPSRESVIQERCGGPRPSGNLMGKSSLWYKSVNFYVVAWCYVKGSHTVANGFNRPLNLNLRVWPCLIEIHVVSKVLPLKLVCHACLSIVVYGMLKTPPFNITHTHARRTQHWSLKNARMNQ